MWNATKALQVTASQKQRLEGIIQTRTTQQRVGLRARIVQAATLGKPNRVIAKKPNVSRPTVCTGMRALGGGR